jgi:predicted RNA polymerase sigma factor
MSGAFVLAATIRITRDFDVAEECVQDAFARALATWGSSGHPDESRGVADDGGAPPRH